MKIASFDIGIKNLALCILNLETQQQQTIKIVQWNVFNLLEKEKDSNSIITQCMFSSKTKKGTPVICKQEAKYQKDDLLYCKKHANIPKDLSLKIVNKARLDVLYSLAEKYNISIDKSKNKKDIIETFVHFINTKLFKEIVTLNGEEKKDGCNGFINSNNINLIDIGISIKNVLDKHVNIEEIDHILIENQISPIANRMKGIQCMLSQYFIMRGKYNIHFISSSNKLKLFTDPSSILKNSVVVEKKEGMANYSYRKKIGISITKNILSDISSSYYHVNNSSFFNWFVSHKKKDDLADSFLQGLWYIQTKLKNK